MYNFDSLYFWPQQKITYGDDADDDADNDDDNGDGDNIVHDTQLRFPFIFLPFFILYVFAKRDGRN